MLLSIYLAIYDISYKVIIYRVWTDAFQCPSKNYLVKRTLLEIVTSLNARANVI